MRRPRLSDRIADALEHLAELGAGDPDAEPAREYIAKLTAWHNSARAGPWRVSYFDAAGRWRARIVEARNRLEALEVAGRSADDRATAERAGD